MSLAERIEALVRSLEYPAEEQRHLVRLMTLFAELPCPPDPDSHFPRYEEHKNGFLDSIEGQDADAL